MPPRKRRVAHKVIDVGWQTNAGVWLECECGWFAVLGFEATLDDLNTAAQQHRKEAAA